MDDLEGVPAGAVAGDEGSPADSPDPGAAPEAFSPDRVRAAFRGAAIPAKRLPLSYRLWTLAVAGVMVTLPLIYLAILAAGVYAMVWHATHNAVIFERVRNGKAAVVGYFGPLIALGTMVFFMAKPLLARRPPPSARRSIGRNEEPALYALVDGVCKAVGAPRPVRVDIDCDLNASAGPERGLVSLLRRRLVLTIGLPMVAVFDADQFAGVLAHEFGHFAQSAGMKLTYVIRSINAWFARVVYERDEWDEWLNEWSTSGNIYTVVLGNLARLLVWFSRRLLWALMYVGHAVSCTMSRQMEFDADRCEAFLAGSETSAGATRRLRLAGLAHGGAMTDLSESWKEGRLPDDIPRLVEANIPQIPPASVAAIDEALTREKTKVFDTHPADRDRVAAVLRLHAPGVFHIEGPATAFFRDFDALSREVTAEHYRGMMGESFDPTRLQPYREIVSGYEGRLGDAAALGRVYGGSMTYDRPLRLPDRPPAVEASPDDVRAELERARAEQRAARAGREALMEAGRGDMARWARAEAAEVMLSSGYRVKPALYGLASATVESARSTVAEVGRDAEGRSAALDHFDTLAARRIGLALGLLASDEFAAKVDGGEGLRAEADSLLPIASALAGRAWLPLREVVRARAVLLTVLGAYRDDERNEGVRRAALAAASDLHGRLVTLRKAIGDDLAYPFAHAQGPIPIAEHALPAVPGADDVGGLLNLAEHAGERLISLYYRVVGRLAAAVERVEGALGLPPLAFEDESGDNHSLG